MSNDSPNSSEVNNKQIMHHIRTQIYKAATTHQHHTYTNAKLLYPAKPADIPYNLKLYSDLETTQTLIPNFRTDLQLKQNPLTKLPFIGKIIHTLQTQLHQVALFYANRNLRYQVELNHHLFASLEQLTIETQKQQRVISQLQEQIQQTKEPAL